MWIREKISKNFNDYHHDSHEPNIFSNEFTINLGKTVTSYLIALHGVEAAKSDEFLEMVDGGEAGHPHVLPRQLLQLALVLWLQHQVHLLVKSDKTYISFTRLSRKKEILKRSWWKKNLTNVLETENTWLKRKESVNNNAECTMHDGIS